MRKLRRAKRSTRRRTTLQRRSSLRRASIPRRKTLRSSERVTQLRRTTPRADTSPIWPTTSVRVTQAAHEGHNAIDIGGNIGDPIYASGAGTIIRVKNQPGGYGLSVTMLTDSGKELLYGHLSGVNVREGQRVSAGQTIGALGSTGNSTGPHLHYEVRDPSISDTFLPGWRSAISAINPMSFLGLVPTIIAGRASYSTPMTLRSPPPEDSPVRGEVTDRTTVSGEVTERTIERGTLWTGLQRIISPTPQQQAYIEEHRDEVPTLFKLEVPLFTVLQRLFFPTEEQRAYLREHGLATFPISMLTVGVGVIITIIAIWQISAGGRKAAAGAALDVLDVAKIVAPIP